MYSSFHATLFFALGNHVVVFRFPNFRFFFEKYRSDDDKGLFLRSVSERDFVYHKVSSPNMQAYIKYMGR